MFNEFGSSICSFGAEVLTKHVTAMQNEAPGVQEAVDIEYIHRMRVASRRFRSVLPIFAGCFPEKTVQQWSKDIRGVTRSLGAARDMDVQIAHLQSFHDNLTERKYQAGLRRMLLRLRQQRDKMQSNVIKNITRIQENQTLTEMLEKLSTYRCETAQYDRDLFQLARDNIMSRLEDLFIHEQAILEETNIEELHATRISTKYLRYTLETFGALYDAGMKQEIQYCREIQDTLGTIHDCDVWAILIPQFIESERERVEKFYGSYTPMLPLLPGIRLYQASQVEQRKTLHHQFLRQWTEFKQKGVWANLVETIQSRLMP
ncbi:MAG: CHAD domain-containing protein [Anaerolineae bacterium]|jgi:CHAD domain-containing protein|nr:CHAD domain-containing protein [Anaerolineae bacterium]